MKTLKEKIKVMQAALDGADIDFKLNGGVWNKSVDPLELEWMWTEFDYRVTPKPIECWVNVLDGETCSSVYMSKESADESRPKMSDGWTTRKFREVIE